MTIRSQFPIFRNSKKPYIYFDNAATTHKPQMVLDAEMNFYAMQYATVHRGIYASAEHATMLYEQARATVANFIGAKDPSEIVFTRGTTESINLVASTWALEHLNVGDEILITELEHHANLLPWQRVARERGAVLNYIPVNFDGTLNLDKLSSWLTTKTKLVAVTHISNAIGIHVDIATIMQQARKVGAKLLIDAAQSVPHQAIDVEKLGADFLVFSGHKMFGPTGIGVLYINKKLHATMPPYQLGGGMVYQAGFYSASWREMPYRLEAGTPPIAQAIGLAAAIDFIRDHIDFDALAAHESSLVTCLIDGLSTIKGVTIIGPREALKAGHIVSFVIDGIHPHDIAAWLDGQGICVRAGHQCAQPLAKRLGLDAAVRVSFYAYNREQEVNELIHALEKLAHL